ncbi:MAG: acylglycerol kinase family protein [Acetobacteraceae bacterium]|nr:acylglycerol kinase family protein [Acetobacteraceae bacterium]
MRLGEGTGSALGIVPVGTGNDVLRALPRAYQGRHLTHPAEEAG